MANPRNETDIDHSVQETVLKVAQETGRTGRMMADVGERTFHANAEMLERNTEAMRHLVQSHNEFASRLTSRSADQFARAMGLGGDQAETAMQQSTRNLAAVMQSSASLSQGMHSISTQWFEFVHQQVEQCMEHVDALMRCRTLQELAVVQSQVMRDQLNAFIDSTRRAADLSAQAANEASRHIKEAAETVRQAA